MRVLIVGAYNEHVMEAIKISVTKGAKVFQALDVELAMKSLRSGKGSDLILIDVNYSVKSLVAALESEHFSVPVIAYGIDVDKEKAVNAINEGAKDYISLPPNEEIIALIFESISCKPNEIIHKSKLMSDAIDIANKVAASTASVFITGESGVGKEVFAKYIHKKSNRSMNELICINCSAIPEHLLESELFGYEKGAFTGAVDRRIGKFEESNGGTIFLDEISEMDLRLQSKLLRVLQEKEISRLGSNKTIKLDLRVIASSNRNIKEYIKQGKFREDLYYRLNVIELQIPPLRERVEDVEVLSEHFIKKYVQLNGLTSKTLSQNAIQKLQRYDWPGNIRELENVIHRAVLLSGSAIEESDLRIEIISDLTLEEIEKRAIAKAVETYKDHSTAAAVLGVTLKTLKSKLSNYKIAV